MPIFSLVDCNNFYVSCERAFNPRLVGKPVVVLSNNDGCVIARSNEAKKLGIPMGAPFFKWKIFCQENNVHVFSSNYELYGDMSWRVMTSLKQFCPEMEIYSIDEAFLLLDSFAKDLMTYVRDVRQKIKQYTGIPVSIGIASTKTLAKVANYVAKNHTNDYVCNLCDLDLREKILAEFPVENIWGIGSQLAKKCKILHIDTAKDLRNANPKMIRTHFSVTVEKIVLELRGISCLSLEQTQARKQIVSSRSFGKPVTKLEELEEAISHYAAIASLKLRNQKSIASGIYVFLETSIFKNNASKYANCTFFPFPVPTADTGYIISIAKKCLRHIFKKGYLYNKTGLMLIDLLPQSASNTDMLIAFDLKKELLMKSIDLINVTMGKNTIFYAAEGIHRPWQVKHNLHSSRYTTSWSELAVAYCK